MWRNILAIAELPDVDADSVWVAGNVTIKGDGGTMHGRVFPVSYRGAAAVGVEVEGRCFSYMFAQHVTANRIRPVAFGAEDARGLFVVTEVAFVDASAFHARRIWFDGTDPEDNAERQWLARARIAAVRPQKTMPGRMRPHGSEVCSLQLIGEIGKDIDGYSLGRAICDAGEATILLNIDSNGGRTDHGEAIYDALAAHPKRVETHVIGKCHSMAVQIAMAGDYRTIVSDGSIVAHEATWAPVQGVDAARALLATAQRSLDTEAAIIARQAGVAIATAQAWIKGEKAFTAPQALTNGLVHEIMTDVVPLKPAALRARFQPVHAPFAAIRPKAQQPKAYDRRAFYQAGQVVLHAGKRWRAVSGGLGVTPTGLSDMWRAF